MQPPTETVLDGGTAMTHEALGGNLGHMNWGGCDDALASWAIMTSAHHLIHRLAQAAGDVLYAARENIRARDERAGRLNKVQFYYYARLNT